jgi:HSP20 family protein
MAILTRRENREVARPSTPDYRWDPFRMMDSLLRWDPFRNDMLPPTFGASDFVARFDVKETKGSYVIKADLPGVDEKDLTVSLTGNQLTISGKRDEEQRNEGDQYFAIERSHGSFVRTFSMPDSVDGEHVTADMKDGVLTVQIPKRPEAQPKKISVGKGAPDAAKAKA